MSPFTPRGPEAQRAVIQLVVSRRNPAARLPRKCHALGKISRHFDADLKTVLDGLGRASFGAERQRAGDPCCHRHRRK
jgi:hypothetical protein